MALLNQCILLLAVVCETFSVLIVQRGDVYDTIRNVSKRACKRYKGTYDASRAVCQCRRYSTFMSSGKLRGSRHVKCRTRHKRGCTRYSNSKSKRSCGVAGIFVWNMNSKGQGLWVNATQRFRDHFVTRPSFNGTFPGISTSLLVGQLIRISLKCRSTCYLLRMSGQRSYPFHSGMFDVRTTPNSRKSNKLKMAVVISTVVIVTVLLITLIILYIFRQEVRRCSRGKVKDDVIYTSETHAALGRTQSPVYASIKIQPPEDEPYEDIHTKHGDGVYYSSISSPLDRSDSSSVYSALNEFSTSPYSALSATDDDVSPQEDTYDSPFNKSRQEGENTSVSRKSASVSSITDHGQCSEPEYEELVPDSTDQTTEPLQGSTAGDAEIVYFEVESDKDFIVV